jgi:tetratricopeptide (TPR) repeat protein
MAPGFRTLAFGVAALAAASALSLRLAGQIQSRPFDVLHVPAGKAARWLALGHRGLLSDLYWLDAVQYIGEPRADARGWDKLYPLLDLVTDLDPRHGYAYQTGGIVLSAAGRLEESNRILQKGMERGPRSWAFPYYVAFNYWFYLGDYAAAAWYADIAARTPGASPNVSHLAVALASKSGSPDLALDMLAELRHAVKDEATSARLDEQVKLATLERDCQVLERAAARFEAERGRPIRSLAELLESGYLSRIPPDPFGGSYQWHADEKQVRSSANPFRFSLRQAPQTPKFHYQPPPGAEEIR